MSLFWVPWKKYADFSGRADRPEFWVFTIIDKLIMFGILMASVIFFGTPAELPEDAPLNVLDYLFFLYQLAGFLPRWSVTVRRLHDTGKSGWYIMLGFIPFLGPLVLLIMTLQGSEKGPNQYGPGRMVYAEVFE